MADCNGLTFRFAEKEDAELILDFIKRLAEYERLSDLVVATPELLRRWIFAEKKAEVVFAVLDGREAAFALFFHSFSTFLGRAGIYIEDLFVLPEHRGRGVGSQLLSYVAGVAAERGCGRLEWSCLDWNEPSIGFYLSRGAKPMSDWTMYRVDGEGLSALAGLREGRT